MTHTILNFLSHKYLRTWAFIQHIPNFTFQGPGVTSVDRRPSKILVSGFELDEKDSLVEHFAKFGEIVDTLEVRLSNFFSEIIENKTG